MKAVILDAPVETAGVADRDVLLCSVEDMRHPGTLEVAHVQDRLPVPNDDPGNPLLGVLSQDDQLVGALNQGQIGAMGASDTVNDIAALAALSDLDQDERIERVDEMLKRISC